MKLKSGKELSQLEIMKRLNAMGIKYNSDIIGKNYYINLYDEAIQSNSNLMKIMTDLNKDKMHTDFYNQKLRKVNECSLRICDNNNKNLYKYALHNNNLILRKNCDKKGFFSDYNDSLINKILIANIAYDFVDANKEYINKIGITLPKISIPFQAIKKCTLNIYSKIVEKLNRILDILNDLMAEKFIFISIIIICILIIIILLLFRKKKKNNRK